jgi:hypothetical protein
MKPEVMLELLENAAEQLGIKVSYEPLQTGGLQSTMRGGLCRVKGAYRIIIDKRATSEERVATLAGAIASVPSDTTDLELAPQVRELLRLYRRDRTGPRRAA